MEKTNVPPVYFGIVKFRINWINSVIIRLKKLDPIEPDLIDPEIDDTIYLKFYELNKIINKNQISFNFFNEKEWNTI